ncbi:hypothetical protein DRQ50_01460 [bacterium]|nr:MAG: hypothetical protein DRQ50_01460 [bacterium]
MMISLATASGGGGIYRSPARWGEMYGLNLENTGCERQVSTVCPSAQIPFFGYPDPIRKVIYTTNAIESLPG